MAINGFTGTPPATDTRYGRAQGADKKILGMVRHKEDIDALTVADELNTCITSQLAAYIPDREHVLRGDCPWTLVLPMKAPCEALVDNKQCWIVKKAGFGSTGCKAWRPYALFEERHLLISVL